MKVILIMILVTSNTYAGLFSESARDYSKNLGKIGDRIVTAVKKGKPVNWSCEVDEVNYCEKDTLKVYDIHKKEVEVKGRDLKAYLDSLKLIEEKERKCLGKDNSKYTSAKSEQDFWKIAKCLKSVKYRFKKPNHINFFGFDPRKIFNSKNRDMIVTQLEGKAHNLKQAKEYKRKKQLESNVVTNKQFREHQKKVKSREKKYLKYGVIPASTSLISDSSNRNKSFRILIEASKAHNITAFNGGYSFSYMNLENTGFRHSGKGQYFLTCKSKKCFDVARWETETYKANDAKGTFMKRDILRIKNFDAIVSYTGKNVDGVNGLGQRIVLPVLSIQETY